MLVLWKWIRHNQGVALSLLVSSGLMVWIAGCESKVSSLLLPNQKVTSAELEVELLTATVRLEADLDLLIRSAAVKRADLERQDAIKQKFVNFIAITVDAGTVNPTGVVALMFSVLGIGAVVDNRLKDKVIKNRPLVKQKTEDRGQNTES